MGQIDRPGDLSPASWSPDGDDLYAYFTGRPARSTEPFVPPFAGGRASAAPAGGFPLPSQVRTAPGCEGWEEMYPYFTRFRPEDEQRFWFYNGMHFPEPMPAFDVITAEAPYVALGAINTRVFVIPTVKGIDHRIVNGRIYISAMPVLDPAEIERRAKLFQERAFYYYGNWNKLYDKWKEKIMALIRELQAIKVPELPEFDDDAVVKEARGVSQNHYVLEAYHRAIEGYFKMWQYHFEFLILGYGAYATFFEFCKKAFPEIADQTVARMVAGVDTLMFRADDELKKLARLAVELKLDEEFSDGREPAQLLAALKRRGKAGAEWLAALEKARDPWFNISTGDGFYHHHRSWNDDLAVPFSALPRYVREIKAGRSVERPTAELKRERERIRKEYRALLATDEDRASFDQMLGLSELVFPYVEDHKFYCEHWATTLFFNKMRDFAKLLARNGFFDDPEDMFHLHYSEVGQALSDLMLGWSAGTAARAKAHWGAIVARRKRVLERLADWAPPPALGPVPENVNDAFLNMLWGITSERLKAWAQPPGSGNELRGFPASRGVVEGPARVVKSVGEIATVREGDILVCPVTAPSWAPVFGKIKAAVSDIGGTMSHAAIVCREYGMPAVVGTGHATKVIRTGQRLRVDGTNGVVTVLG
jgi:pyruvate,water dikinase